MKREERDEEGMGSADLKFGESTAFFQHLATGRWLSYQTFETKKRGLGRVEEKRAVLLAEVGACSFFAAQFYFCEVGNDRPLLSDTFCYSETN